MEVHSTISDEEIQRQENLKNQLLVKTAGQTNKRASSSEHRDDLRTLSTLEQSLEDAAHYYWDGNSRDVSVAGDVAKSNEVRYLSPPSFFLLNFDAFLTFRSSYQDDDTLFFDSSTDVDAVVEEHIKGVIGGMYGVVANQQMEGSQDNANASLSNMVAPVQTANNKTNGEERDGAASPLDFPSSIFNYETCRI
jgi:hypothetical protein